MRKAMGSLLLCIYLSSTPQHCNDSLSMITLNELVKNKYIVSAVKKRKDELEKDLNYKITSLIGKIDYNMFRLKSLFNIQKKLFEKVKTAMGLKAKSKESLTTEQMDSYRNYINTYVDNKENIELNMNKISFCNEISDVKKELFKNEINYSKVYGNFYKINKIHEKLINLLDDIIFKGNKALTVLA